MPGISQQLFRSDWLGKKIPPSPSTGQISRLTSRPGGSRRIAELSERLSCFVCEIVEKTQQGIKQGEENFSVTDLPGHIPAQQGKVWGAAQVTQGGAALQVGLLTTSLHIKPFNVIIQ